MKPERRRGMRLFWMVAILALASAALGAVYSIDWQTFESGAVNAVGGPYALHSVIAQPDDSPPMSGGSYQLTGGFLAQDPDEASSGATKAWSLYE